ncbi:cell division protein FtsX [Nonomuraea sp. NPDC050556]|uniref:cell division protein FtsX n=1 Tax=Nonomuraea sp. NPDC050556 TaxID=3364369 RepID=UPI003796DC70
MNSEVEQRLREALNEVGALVTPETLKPLPTVSAPRRPRVDVRHAVAAVAIVIAGATATTLWLPDGQTPDPDVNTAAIRPTTSYENTADINVFLCTKASSQPSCESRPKGVTNKDLTAILKKIKSLPGVAQVYYEDQAKAYEVFKASADSGVLKGVLRVEDFPASFRITLTPNADATPIITALQSRPGVASIVDHRCTPNSPTPQPTPTSPCP